MLRHTLPLLALLALGCLTPREVPRAKAEPRVLWVDGAALEDGDGSVRLPFRSLTAALGAAGAGPARLQLRSGLYSGPFSLQGDLSLEGHGAVVLTSGDASGTVVSTSGKVALSRLSIQGGAVGLESQGDLALETVTFSGQRKTALRATGGRLTVRGSHLTAAVSEGVGVLLEGSAKATLDSSRFQGPYRRAVEMSSTAELEVRNCTFEGPVTGVHQKLGVARLRGLALAGGRGAALFSSATMFVEDVDVFGHEYGLLTGTGAKVQVRGLRSVRADRAGVALVGASGTLSDLLIVDSGSFGGIQLHGSHVTVDRARIFRATTYGINATGGEVALRDVVVERVVDEPGGGGGDGFHFRRTRATLASSSVSRAAGVGVLVAEGAEVRLRDVDLARCQWGGVLVETLGQLDAVGLSVQDTGSAAVVVPDGSTARVDVLRSQGNPQGAIWAECDRGASARLSRLVEPGEKAPASRCVDRR